MIITFADNWLPALLAWRWPAELALSSTNVTRYSLHGVSDEIPLHAIIGSRIRAGWSFFGYPLTTVLDVDVQTRAQNDNVVAVRKSLLFAGGNRADEANHRLIAAVRHRLQQLANEQAALLAAIEADAKTVLRPGIYVRGSEMRKWREAVASRQPAKALHQLQTLIRHPLFPSGATSTIAERIARVTDLLSSDGNARHEHNQRFIDEQKHAYAAFFKKVETQALTDEQIKAALVFDDANLVIAAAGSGKTSVIVAKAGYAIAAGMMDESEILALAFNKKAAKELQARLRHRLTKALGRRIAITARTFHSEGMFLLGKPPTEKDWIVEQLDEPNGRRRFMAAFDQLSKKPDFRNALLRWAAFARYPEPTLEGGGDDDHEENERRYQRACREQVRKKRMGEIRQWGRHIPTLDPKLYVRSIEESIIANWLLLHHVPFRYEKEIRKPELLTALGVPLTRNGKQRPYQPDFVYTHPTNPKILIYHEHFGLDGHGNAPDFLGGKKYAQRAQQKRRAFHETFAWVAKKNQPLPFFETRSAWVRDGSIEQRLEQELTRRGIPVSEIDPVYEKAVLAEFRDPSNLQDTFLHFVQCYRESGLTRDEVMARARSSSEPYRAVLFLDVALALAEVVDAEYRGANHIEYCDMLSRGAAAVASRGQPPPFKLILVDEFQDIARLRMNLVRQLADRNPEAILFFVGDDWQAINRFAGSDIGIFRSYLPRPPAATAPDADVREHGIAQDGRSTHAVSLTQTFRSAQGIADVARALVMKNPGQIDKRITSIRAETKQTLRVVEHHDTAQARKQALIGELERIAQRPLPQDENKKTRLHDVFVLTRNMADTAVPEGLEPEHTDEIATRFASRLRITRETMHASKGLEADYTIIAGLDAGFRGFPDNREQDPLLALVLPPFADPLEEERRLLYVALTRAKRQVVLLTAAIRPSEYILELEQLKALQDRIEWVSLGLKRYLCPACRRGALRLNKRGDRVECSRYPRCGYRSTADLYPDLATSSEPSPLAN